MDPRWIAPERSAGCEGASRINERRKNIHVEGFRDRSDSKYRQVSHDIKYISTVQSAIDLSFDWNCNLRCLSQMVKREQAWTVAVPGWTDLRRQRRESSRQHRRYISCGILILMSSRLDCLSLDCSHVCLFLFSIRQQCHESGSQLQNRSNELSQQGDVCRLRDWLLLPLQPRILRQWEILSAERWDSVAFYAVINRATLQLSTSHVSLM